MTKEKDTTPHIDDVTEVVEVEEIEAVETDTMEVEAEDLTEIPAPTAVGLSPIVGVTPGSFYGLTKRNQQFMVSLDKHLTTTGMSDGIKESIYTEMTETLLEGQQNGQTARQLYGTPTETAEVIFKQNFQDETVLTKSPDWQIALDGGLILGSIFTFIAGVSALNNEGQPETMLSMGLITLIINYVVGGFAMLATSKVMPDMDAPKGKKGYFKYFGVSSLAMIIWVFAITISAAILPPVINPTFSAEVYLLIGAATFGLRFLLKKKLNIVGGIF